jgi:hypothetical protein
MGVNGIGLKIGGTGGKGGKGENCAISAKNGCKLAELTPF